MMASDKIRFVLVNPTHPGNIGAVARAMKNMGLTQLYLVAPKLFPDPAAYVRASGATDLLDNAVIVTHYQEAIADCNLVIGTSARERSLAIPVLPPRESAAKIKAAIESKCNVAILFGQERIGLTNEQLSVCNYHLFIPCNPDFASLNLAAAVQVIAYEIRLALIEEQPRQLEAFDLVSTGEMEQFYQHLEQMLVAIKFLDPDNPRLLMRKLRRIFNRINLEHNELNILRGILSSVLKKR
jgi:tRNA (cytidine32/uridine32-2'-O)-methyltransferase